MRSVVSSFWLPRHGSPVEHYEDAFFPRRTGVRHGPRLRVAVADGASESMLSGLWAELLVRTWCRAPRRRRLDEVVKTAMAAWPGALDAYLEVRAAEQRPIEWFQQPGLDRGAHATVLGLEVGDSPTGQGWWTAESLGDTCLFHVRDDELLRAFPLEDAGAFGNTPKLVPTHHRQLDRVVASLDRAEGQCREGDVLFLATDALAAWFLGAAGTGGAPWRTLSAIARDDVDGFMAWTSDQRAAGAMRNDDVTLVRVEVGRP